MVNARRLLCLSLLVLRIAFAKAQDPFISQFFSNRPYLNPAFTGIDDGMQVNVTARNQWYAANKGYSFYTASADFRVPCWNSGFGLMVTHAREGLAPLVSTQGALTYSYGVRGFSGAIQCSLNHKYLDWSRFTFSDELDPVYGDIYDSAVANGEGSVLFPDFAGGVLFRWNARERRIGRTKFKNRWHVGLAVHHLASLSKVGPDASFLHTDPMKVPPRLTLHSGLIIPLTTLGGQSLLISPNIRLESQGSNPLNYNKSQTLFSGGVYFIFMNKFTLGTLYHNRAFSIGKRHTSFVTFTTGYANVPKKEESDAFYVGFSIDVNPNGLGWQSKNTYEFNARYTFNSMTKGCRSTFKSKGTGCPIWD